MAQGTAINSINSRNMILGVIAALALLCFYLWYQVRQVDRYHKAQVEEIKLKTMEDAQNAPSPATIFSLFLDGKFMTTDLSVCMDSRYYKIIDKLLIQTRAPVKNQLGNLHVEIKEIRTKVR